MTSANHTLYISTDGSSHVCDILVGADGLHSTVRKLVLEEGDPAAHPQNSGWWTGWALAPYAEAEEYLDTIDRYQHSWCGDGMFVIHSVSSGDQMVFFALCGYDGDAGDKQVRSITAEEIRGLYKNWSPQLLGAIEKVFCSKPQQDVFYLWEHALPASTYVRGPMCIMGDAAHATTPW